MKRILDLKIADIFNSLFRKDETYTEYADDSKRYYNLVKRTSQTRVGILGFIHPEYFSSKIPKAEREAFYNELVQKDMDDDPTQYMFIKPQFLPEENRNELYEKYTQQYLEYHKYPWKYQNVKTKFLNAPFKWKIIAAKRKMPKMVEEYNYQKFNEWWEKNKRKRNIDKLAATVYFY